MTGQFTMKPAALSPSREGFGVPPGAPIFGPVDDVARRDDGIEPLTRGPTLDRLGHGGAKAPAKVQIGDVENAKHENHLSQGE